MARERLAVEREPVERELLLRAAVEREAVERELLLRAAVEREPLERLVLRPEPDEEVDLVSAARSLSKSLSACLLVRAALRRSEDSAEVTSL